MTVSNTRGAAEQEKEQRGEGQRYYDSSKTMRKFIYNRFRNRNLVAATTTSILLQSFHRQNYNFIHSSSSSSSSFSSHINRAFISTTNTPRSSSTTTPFCEKDDKKQNDVGDNKPQTIKIVEVGPRDGLQNEAPPIVSVKDKLEFIRRLERAGCSNIEVGAFVSPKWIPQMSGSSDVLDGLLAKERKKQDQQSSDDINNSSSSSRSRYSVLVPNLKGLEQALLAGGGPNEDGRGIIDEIAIFGAASEEFTKRNINSTIDESMERFRAVVDRVREVQQAHHSDNDKPLLVRGYVSTVIACPYQGVIEPKQVAYTGEKCWIWAVTKFP